MRNFTLLKMMLLAIAMVGSMGVWGQAILPFNYDGGNPGTTITGLTQTGLGSDYTSSPKMKFDTSGDNLVLFFDKEPGLLSFKIKWNQSVAATRFPGDFTLQESTDGINYTEVQLYNSTSGTALPNGTTITETFSTLKSTTRYLKWIYTTKTNGNIALGAITLSAASTSPTIVTSPATLSAFYTTVGSPANQTISVNGTNLTAAITASISGTNQTEFSIAPTSFAQTGGAVTNQTLTVTYNPSAAGSHTALLTLSSAGATDVVYTLNGSADWPALEMPLATAATGITQTGFTANWDAVTNATSYNLNVYTKTGTTTVEPFDAAPTAPTDWTFTGVTSYTSTSTGYFGASAPSVKFDTSNDQIITPTYTFVPSKISFWLRGSSTDQVSALLVEGTSDGTNWTTIENIKPLPTTAVRKEYANTSSYTQFRFTYTKSAGNAAFDDFTVYSPDYKITPITGSPFDVSTNSYNLTGLITNTTYYYTVTAYNTNVTSGLSNEISAITTSATGISSNKVVGLFAFNGKVFFNAAAGETVEIFNSIGQRIVSQIAVEGRNEVPVTGAKGVLVVKVANRISKVIM